MLRCVTVWVVRLLIIFKNYLAQLFMKLCRVRCRFILTSSDLYRPLTFIFTLLIWKSKLCKRPCWLVFVSMYIPTSILRAENKDFGHGLGLMINYTLSCIFLIIHRTVEGTFKSLWEIWMLKNRLQVVHLINFIVELISSTIDSILLGFQNTSTAYASVIFHTLGRCVGIGCFNPTYYYVFPSEYYG